MAEARHPARLRRNGLSVPHPSPGCAPRPKTSMSGSSVRWGPDDRLSVYYLVPSFHLLSVPSCRPPRSRPPPRSGKVTHLVAPDAHPATPSSPCRTTCSAPDPDASRPPFHRRRPGRRDRGRRVRLRSGQMGAANLRCRRIPAIQVRFSRYSVRVALDTPHRQGWQIVQSHLTLDDSLP